MFIGHLGNSFGLFLCCVSIVHQFCLVRSKILGLVSAAGLSIMLRLKKIRIPKFSDSSSKFIPKQKCISMKDPIVVKETRVSEE